MLTELQKNLNLVPGDWVGGWGAVVSTGAFLDRKEPTRPSERFVFGMFMCSCGGEGVGGAAAEPFP